MPKFQAAYLALKTASSVDEVKRVRDQAEAIRLYVKKQKMGLEMQNTAAELKLKAERRAGEMLKGMDKAKGAAKKGWKTLSRDGTPLPELDITRNQSHRWQTIARLPEEAFESYIQENKEGAKEITTAGALKLYKQREKKQAKDEIVERLNAQPTLEPGEPVDVLVVDPPWRYDSRAQDATHRAANPYPDMTPLEIAKLSIPKELNENAIVWLWTTNAFMNHAFVIAGKWGLKVKTILTWAKDRMGTGDWLRGQTEHCLLCVKGKPTITLTNQTTLLRGPLREHSRKPEEFFDLVNSLCPGTKREKFGREKRPGWDVEGIETEKFS